MNLIIHDAYPSITPATLDAVERRSGRPVPAAYREFLLVHNGGYPEPADFEITHRDGRIELISVEWFFPVAAQDSIDLEQVLRRHRGRYPDTLFPFACDPGGNLIFVAVSGEKAGQIWFWDHEEEAEEGAAPTWDNLYFVAESFDAFLANLK